MRRLQALIEYNMIPQFKVHTLGITREDMPQISANDQNDFFDYLADEGIKIHPVSLRANKIHPTQKEINSDKVDKWVIGEKPLIISSDNYILDGHHQWAKIMTTDPLMDVKCIKVETPIKNLLDLAHKFSKVEYKTFKESSGMKKLENLLKNGLSTSA